MNAAKKTRKRFEAWLAAHPNVTFHFTPTGASWLNQVKIWFNILTRQALDRASFASLDQLVQALHDYTAKNVSFLNRKTRCTTMNGCCRRGAKWLLQGLQGLQGFIYSSYVFTFFFFFR